MYYLLVGMAVFFAFLCNYSQNKVNSFFFKYTVFCILVIPLMIRKGVGTDYYNYVSIFNGLKTGGWSSVDAGWKFLNYLVIILNLSSNWVFIISGFFTVYFFYKNCEKEFICEYVLLFLFFLYFPGYNIIRQILGICICIYAFRKEDKKKRYFLFCLACFFHATNILFVLFSLFTSKSVLDRDKTIILGIVLFVLFSVLHLSKFVPMLLSLFDTRYSYYLSVLNSGIQSRGLTLLLDQFFLFFTIFTIDEKRIPKEKQIFVYRMFLVAIVFYSIARDYIIFARFKYSFYSIFFICVPYRKNQKIYKCCSYLFYALYLLLLLWNIKVGDNGINPYQTIF